MLLDAQQDAALQRTQESASLTARMIDADIYRAQSVLRVLARSHSLNVGDLGRFLRKRAMRAPALGAGLFCTT